MLRIDGPATATTLAARLGPQHRADVLPPAPARPARLRRRRPRARQRPRPLVEGRAPVDDHRRRARRPGRGPRGPDAYLQSVAVMYTQQLQAAIEERPLLPEEWRDASTFSDYARAAHRRSRRAPLIEQRCDDDLQEIDEDDDDDPDAAPIRLSSSTRSRAPAMVGTRRATADERRRARRSSGCLIAEAISLTGTRVSMIAHPVARADHDRPARRRPAWSPSPSCSRWSSSRRSAARSSTGSARAGSRSPATCCSVVAVGLIPLLHASRLRCRSRCSCVLVALAGALRGPGRRRQGTRSSRRWSPHAGVPLERATGLHSAVERTAELRRRRPRRRPGRAASAPADALVVDAVSFGAVRGRPRLGHRVACGDRQPGRRAAGRHVVRRASCARAGTSCAATRCWSAMRGDGRRHQPARPGATSPCCCRCGPRTTAGSAACVGLRSSRRWAAASAVGVVCVAAWAADGCRASRPTCSRS